MPHTQLCLSLSVPAEPSSHSAFQLSPSDRSFVCPSPRYPAASSKLCSPTISPSVRISCSVRCPPLLATPLPSHYHSIWHDSPLHERPPDNFGLLVNTFVYRRSFMHNRPLMRDLPITSVYWRSPSSIGDHFRLSAITHA